MAARLAEPAPRPLPPGQFHGRAFVRFGLGRFKSRKLPAAPPLQVRLRGDVAAEVEVGAQIATLPEVEQISDFHCVTTWSRLGVRWTGVRFADFYHTIAIPMAEPDPQARLVVFHGLDGYRCAMSLDDLLASDDVLLATALDGAPLGVEHGAPLRLIAPAHYGYKNVKHVVGIEFLKSRRGYRFPLPYPSLMDHPRGRVALEERARFLPNWLIRPIYKLFVPKAVRKS